MFKTYLKTSIRNLLKNKTHSLLNIFGLAVGIACAGAIFLWVEDETSYDKFNVNKDRIYAVLENQIYDAGTYTHWASPGPLGPAMKNEIPGVANTCRRTQDETSLLFRIGDKSVYSDGIYADSSLFSIFTLPFVQGSASGAFSQLYSIVLTESAAKKYFGQNENIVGKTILVDSGQEYVVTGVLKDIPTNSTLQFEWVIPYELHYTASPWEHEWGNNTVLTYVELDSLANPASVDKILYNYIQKNVPSSISHLFLFGMNNWHLYDSFENGKQTGGGRIEYVRLFTIIAWVILLIACINFMNLATARSEKRALEVGVRKVLGARRQALAGQFIGEALFMVILAAITAIIIILLALPLFNALVQKNLSIDLANPLHIIALLLIILICGLVAGSYPSLYLSSFNPLFVLKGIKLGAGNSATYIRKGLVIVQFAVSIVLIICTIFIYKQIQHVKNRNLGFNKDNLLEISVHGDMGKKFSVIRQDILNTGVAENAALSNHATLYGGNNTDRLTWPGKPPGSKILISGRSVSTDYFATSGMHIVTGRGLILTDSMYKTTALQQGSSDSTYTIRNIPVVITESLAKLVGNGTPVGEILQNEGDRSTRLIVVGVVNDYVYGDMYSKPDPVAFFLVSKKAATVMYVRLKANTDPEQAISQIEGVLKKDNPSYPFEYRFVDDQFNQMFLGESLISKLSRVFTCLAIVISCLGLFSLAAYVAERRTKEIGVRKVLGATSAGLVRLLSIEFLRLIIISCIVAFPISWWYMHSWLDKYPYRITLNLWIFLGAGVIAILIALTTVAFQTIKAAMANPVKSLRSE